MRLEDHAVRDRIEFADAAPPRHQQEEAEIKQGTDLRDQGADVRRRLDAEVAQDEEVDQEDAVQPLVPARLVADRLRHAAVQPGQREHDDDCGTHDHDTPELGVKHHQRGHRSQRRAQHDDLPQVRKATLQHRENRRQADHHRHHHQRISRNLNPIKTTKKRKTPIPQRKKTLPCQRNLFLIQRE